jgi:phosphoenolpyruvate-protein kinase (PTS system EI component)
LLLGLGAHELSMTPAALPEVRFRLRHARQDEMKALAEQALASPSAAATRGLLLGFATAQLKSR